MCGIAAIWGPGENKSRNSKAMLSAIKHRGHSLYELKEFQRCALGANRLEIVDRSNGKQPASNEDGSIRAIFNGEIFNHRQLKTELEGQGHRYRTDCDTETLVHLYEQYGPAMVQKLDSEMFAFAIYDSKKDSLMVARDRWGVKPLYWAQDSAGAYYFGSEIKELSSLPEIAAVKLFPPGHYFMDGKLTTYYSPGNAPKIKISEEEAALKLRNLIDEAVRKRVDTDLPIGVFLSGGLDSTAILATAKKFHSNVKAIIVGTPDSEDVKFAKRYCEKTSTPFIVRSPPSEQEMFQTIEQTIAICESFEPNVVRQSAVSYYIAKAAQEADLRIVLCGEGADELFMGYPEFKDLGPRMASERQNTFLHDLSRTQFQRVDRTSMHFTIEVRVPFFDQKVVELARSLNPSLLIKEQEGQQVEKYVLRKAMEDRLPPEICWRKKVVMSEGAGYKGNQVGGLFEEMAAAQVSDAQFQSIQMEFPQWNLRTKEEAYYFSKFQKLGYTKAGFNADRVTANRQGTWGGARS